MATVRNTISLKDKMTPVLRSILKALNSTVDALASVDKISDKAFQGVKRDVQNANKAINDLNLDIHDLEKPVQQARSGFSGWQSAIVTANQALQLVQSTMAGINKLTGYADKQTGLTSRLTLMTGSLEEAKKLQDEIMASANRSRASYTATADSVAQMGMMASEAFSKNGVLDTKELVAFTESINKQLVISGVAGTAGADAALYQLTQAMSSGTLRGDELRSIMEQAPVIADTIAKYMGVSKGEMREMAAEGLVTSEIVKNAMLSSLDTINDQFGSMPVTFGQAMTMLKNEAIKHSQPLVESFSKFIQSDSFQKMFQGLMQLLPYVFDHLQRVFDTIVALFDSPGSQQLIRDLRVLGGLLLWIVQAALTVASVIIDNWQWIGPIIWTIVAAMMAWKLVTLVSTIISKIQGLMLGIQAVKAYALAKANLMVAASERTKAMATHSATAAQYGLNAAMLASPITWIILAIIALIAIIFAVIGVINKVTGTTTSAIGVIFGAVLWLASVIWNIVVGVIDGILQLIWTAAQPFLGIFEWILNAVNGGFNGLGGAVANLIGQIINWFLSLGKVVTKIIDAIFGTDWTGGLNALSDKVLAWGKNENAITISRDAPTLESMTGGAVGRWASKDAYNMGYDAGANVQESMSDMLGGFNIDDLTSKAEELAKQQGELNDLAGGANGGVTVQGEVSITDEDIKMLKDVAAAEWVNKYTTLRPEMTVTFGDVHETADAGKLLDAIETMVEEAYASVLTGG